MSIVSWVLKGRQDTDAKLNAITKAVNDLNEIIKALPTSGNLGARVDAIEKSVAEVRASIGDVSQLP